SEAGCAGHGAAGGPGGPPVLLIEARRPRPPRPKLGDDEAFALLAELRPLGPTRRQGVRPSLVVPRDPADGPSGGDQPPVPADVPVEGFAILGLLEAQPGRNLSDPGALGQVPADPIVSALRNLP